MSQESKTSDEDKSASPWKSVVDALLNQKHDWAE